MRPVYTDDPEAPVGPALTAECHPHQHLEILVSKPYSIATVKTISKQRNEQEKVAKISTGGKLRMTTRHDLIQKKRKRTRMNSPDIFVTEKKSIVPGPTKSRHWNLPAKGSLRVLVEYLKDSSNNRTDQGGLEPDLIELLD
ncbi:uncharacterized protein LOC144359450 [Saccoglossus kowalevskii]